MSCKDCHDIRDYCNCETPERGMKITITFDDLEEAKQALNASNYKGCLMDVWNNVFRPNNKHGYGDELLDSEEAYMIIKRLTERYTDTVRYWDVDA